MPSSAKRFRQAARGLFAVERDRSPAYSKASGRDDFPVAQREGWSDVSIAPGLTALTFAFGTSRSGSNLSNQISLFLQGKETA